MYEGQDMPQTDVRSSSGILGKRAQFGNETSPAQSPENMAMHLESSHKIAALIHENLAIISNGLGCSVPQNCAQDKSASQPTMLTMGRGLGNRLSDMLEETNRIRQTLGF
jgi:hypothetical protein